MPLDPYSPCPCGSGKKFKWCCQPIHADIDRAFRQDAEGQHEVALRIMQEVVDANPTNPEALGRQAQLLYQNDRVPDAEAALDRAFSINPDYPFGLLLRGMFRFYDHEFPGALLLFRRAVDAYDPLAVDALAQAYGFIAECEMRLNRPLAARAALRVSLHCRPDQEELRHNLEGLFGPHSPLPAAARRDYTFLSPSASITGNRRAAWDQALAGATTRLSEPARIFERLTTEDPNDAAAWFNLGLARAWLGDNVRAIEALDRYVELEPDEKKAADAWALGEVLRLGHGAEEIADVVEYSTTFQIREPRPVVELLRDWEMSGRLIGAQSNEEQGVLTALVMEGAAGVITSGPSFGQQLRIAAALLLTGPIFRLRHTNKETLDRVAGEAAKKAGPALTPAIERIAPAHYPDVVQDAIVFTAGISDEKLVKERVAEHAARYFEEGWVHKPLKTLNRIPPVDAAGHRTLRKKLRGVIEFIEDCAAGGILQVYDFNRLRRKLGLTGGAPAAGGPLDFNAMGTAELGAVSVQGLSEEQLEQAHRAAIKLDAHELARNFARELVSRPGSEAKPDRSPWYFYLMDRAIAEGNTDEAMDYVNEGERIDCEQNQGRRTADFEVRRARLHAKRGEADLAHEVFERLLQRDPGNQKTRAAATETMLSLKQGSRALKFAEEGLARARQQNDRDSEQHFEELATAAKKQGGS